MEYKIINGDCLDVMREMADNSIDFIVCDPPYGLHFMGKKWDGAIPAIDIWAKALRICKPGAMMATFGGSRTHHHLMLAIEGAGWEIRDVVMWVYGQGFPKSHNFGKKIGGDWQGYGTALKPAYEPIIIAMKPLDGTFAENAEKWGIAGINVGSSRIGNEGATKRCRQMDYPKNEDGTEDRSQHWARTGHDIENLNKGRWPANIIFDEEAAKELDAMTGIRKTGVKNIPSKVSDNFFSGKKNIVSPHYGDSGGASRYFYCAKASSRERNKGLDKPSSHPTVKPIALMKYIITLLAPPGNPILLDPFAGSGSTLIAAKELGISAIGIEKEPEYAEIAQKRLENTNTIKKETEYDLFTMSDDRNTRSAA